MPTPEFQTQQAVELVLHLNLFRITSMQTDSKQHSQNRWRSHDGPSQCSSSQSKPGLDILATTTITVGTTHMSVLWMQHTLHEVTGW